jgi:hypothetical protein
MFVRYLKKLSDLTTAQDGEKKPKTSKFQGKRLVLSRRQILLILGQKKLYIFLTLYD